MPPTMLSDGIHYSVLFPNKPLFPVEQKVFRSTYYVPDVRPSITKLDPKALKCIFLGYLDFIRDIVATLLTLENI